LQCPSSAPPKHPLDKCCERDKNCCDIIKIDYASTENASSKLRIYPNIARQKIYDVHNSSQDHGNILVNRSMDRSQLDLQNEPNITLPAFL
jgi:hypothetical protein